MKYVSLCLWQYSSHVVRVVWYFIWYFFSFLIRVKYICWLSHNSKSQSEILPCIISNHFWSDSTCSGSNKANVCSYFKILLSISSWLCLMSSLVGGCFMNNIVFSSNFYPHLYPPNYPQNKARVIILL